MSITGWPIRILLLIGAIFVAQNLWSISVVRVEPLKPSADIPTFNDVRKKIGAEPLDHAETYRLGVQRAFLGVKEACTEESMRGLAHSVAWMYINAVGSAARAGAPRMQDGPAWGKEEALIHNYVGALAQAGVLRTEHFSSGDLGRTEGQIPLAGDQDFPHVYPDWAEPPLTLDCPRN